jgi:hypothetical protein
MSALIPIRQIMYLQIAFIDKDSLVDDLYPKIIS